MARMSGRTAHHLRLAVADPELVARYWSHIKTGRADECWLWTGAISGKGHGRFQIAAEQLPQPDGSIRRRTYVVIAHRFGYAALHGVDALLDVPLLAHQCDNPLCQNPRCWRESNHRANAQDYGRRRDVVRGALADTRGARGRARAVRDAARDGAEISEAVLAGLRPVHLAQLDLFSAETDAVQTASSSTSTTNRYSTSP